MSSIFTLSEHKRSTNKALAGKGKKTYNRGTEIRLPDKNFCRRKRRKKEEAYGTTGSGHAVKFFKSEAAGFLRESGRAVRGSGSEPGGDSGKNEADQLYL